MKLASSNKSIQHIALTGFTLVALPLCIAVILAFVKLDTLSQQGKSGVQNVAEMTKLTRLVQDTVYDLERYTRQFLILDDPKLLTLFDQRLDKAVANANKLQGQYPEEMNDLISRIQANLELIRRQLDSQQNIDAKLVLNEFNQVNRFTDALVQLSYSQMNASIESINAHANDTRLAIIQAATVIPISLITAILFIYLISRPLTRLKPQIAKLEQGNFDEEIQVEGAKDVADIAHTLNVMRQRLNYLENQKTRFIRQISHELKTPLAAIKESADLLANEVVGPLSPQQSEISKIMLSGTDRLQQLIEDLIQFNLVLAKDKERQDVDVNALVDEVSRAYHLALEERQVQINKEIATEHLWTNEAHLRVILDNLISNAIKYTPPQSSITIKGSHSRADYHIEIEDEGPGVPEEIQQQIFEPFFHGPKPDYSKINSNGLGLAICRELVDSYQGTIEQTNLTPGNRFKVTFPSKSIMKSES